MMLSLTLDGFSMGPAFTDMNVKKAISHFLETVTYLKHRLKEMILNWNKHI